MTRRSREFWHEVKVIRSFCGEISSLYRSLELSAFDPWAKEIKATLGRFDLLILGKYNAGKSSLLNLLLSLQGNERLPTHVRPTTTKFWKIGYAASPRLAGMRFSESTPVFLRRDRLSSILSELESEAGKILCENVDFFKLGLPVDWLKKTGWFFWDSPGKDDPEKLLDDTLLKEALTRSDAILIATSFEQHGFCKDYINQASSYSPGCLVVLLTNSGKRPASEFAASVVEHMRIVRENLTECLPAPTIFSYIDSNNVRESLERCAESCNTIQSIIGQWKAGASSSKEPFSRTVAEMNEAANTIENGGLFGLWQMLEVLRRIEEPLVLSKAWSAFAKYLRDAEFRVEKKIAAAQAALDHANAVLAELQDKADVAMFSLSHEELAKRIEGLLESALDRKAKGFRESVNKILDETVLSHKPGILKRVWRVMTFGKLVGTPKSGNEQFRAELTDALKSETERFVSGGVWPLLQDTFADVVKQARDHLATQFSQKTGQLPASDTAPIPVAQLSGDILEAVFQNIPGEILERVSDAALRESKKLQKKFLEAVEAGAKQLTNTMIQHAAKSLASPLEEECENLKCHAIDFFQREIAKQHSMCGDLNEGLCNEQKNIESVINMKSRCSENIEKHQVHIQTTLAIKHETDS